MARDKTAAAAFGTAEVTQITRRETSVLHKIRWSLRQRLRRRLLQLSVECLDEIDDVLFTGRAGEEQSAGVQAMDAMREVRAKRAEFLARLTEAVVERLRSKDSNAPATSGKLKAGISVELTARDRMEIELVLDAMQRRSERRYQKTLVDIATLQQKRRQQLQGNVIAATELLRDIVQGFAEAQLLFRVPLQTRLVVCKLFEQQVLLQLDEALQDIVSILRRADDEKFVAKLFTSSSDMRQRNHVEQSQQTTRMDQHQEQLAGSADSSGRQAQQAVDKLLADHIDEATIPSHIAEMIRSHWRSVLFMLALQHGVDSAEWSEAKYALLLLLSACEDSKTLSDSDKTRLLTRFDQGFRQIRLNDATRESLLADLQTCLSCLGETWSIPTGSDGLQESSADGLALRESSISPAGEGLLQPDDLSELADLFGDSISANRESLDSLDSSLNSALGTGATDATRSPDFGVAQATLASSYADRELSVCLNAIDTLSDRISASIDQAGRPQPCVVIRMRENGEQDGFEFELYLKETRRSLKQSRLALALALQAGDLRFFPSLGTTTASGLVSATVTGAGHQKTVLSSDLRRH